MALYFDGHTPLKGIVTPSGSVYSALSIIASSLLFEKTLIENVPKVPKIEELLSSIKDLGVGINWFSNKTLELELSSLTNDTVTSPPLIVPVLARFGTVRFPRKILSLEKAQFFESCGVVFSAIDKNNVLGTLGSIDSLTISTEHSLELSIAALLLCTKATGLARLTNFLLTEETLDLIDFLKVQGFKVTSDSKTSGEIMIDGVAAKPTDARFSLPASALESAFWLSAAVISYGDITIKNASRERLISFLSKVSSLGAHFEFDGEDLRAWQDEGHPLVPIEFEITKEMPLYDFLPLLLPLILRANVTSYVRGINLDEEIYVKDLNLFNAKILNGAVTGPVALKGSRVALPNFLGGLAVILAALGSSGKSEILEDEAVCDYVDSLPQKLNQLSGKI